MKKEEAVQDYGLVAPFLKSKGIHDYVIDKMELSATNAGNIRVRVKGFQDLILLRRNGGLVPSESIPDTWFEGPIEGIDTARLRQSHPLRDCIKEIFCIKKVRGFYIRIVPAENSPYELVSSINREFQFLDSIYDWFPTIDLIRGPGSVLLHKAAAIIGDAVQNCTEKYNSLVIPDGVARRKELDIFQRDNSKRITRGLKSTYSDRLFTIVWEEFSVRYDIETESFSGVEENFSKCFEALEKSQKAILEAKKLCEKINGEQDGIKASYDLSLSPLKTVISVTFHNSKARYTITNRAFRKDAGAVSQAFEADLEKDRETDRQLREKYEQEFRESKACGSLLADCIVDTVRINDQNYRGISLNALVKKVRGLSTDFYDKGRNAGCFNMIPNTDVINMIHELEALKIIGSRRVKGEYTEYVKCYLADADKANYIMNLGHPESGFGDKDWLAEIQNSSGMLGWEAKLEILDHPAVYCVDSDAYIKYFSSAPETIMTYIKMLSKMGEGIKKKLCKQILSGLK